MTYEGEPRERTARYKAERGRRVCVTFTIILSLIALGLLIWALIVGSDTANRSAEMVNHKGGIPLVFMLLCIAGLAVALASIFAVVGVVYAREARTARQDERER